MRSKRTLNRPDSDWLRAVAILLATPIGMVACSDDQFPTLLFTEGPNEEVCSDGLDNDFDGVIDCDDDGCVEALVCGGPGPEPDAGRDASPDVPSSDVPASDVPDPDVGEDIGPPDTRPPEDTRPPDTARDTAPEPDAEPDTPPPPRTFDRSVAADVCERWHVDRGDLREGAWSGDAATCSPGDMDALGRENTLRQVNLVRWLAWLNDDIDDDDDRNGASQACALVTHANDFLSHEPSPDSRCYTPAGAAEAGRSNLSPTPSVEAIDLYMADPGNSTTLGHRRWILSDTLGPIGIGSTSTYSCLGVIGGWGTHRSEWTAWPSPGPFPIQAMNVSWSSVDDNGWSLQSESMNLNRAEVTILEDGRERPVVVNVLAPGYGSASAISIIPDGWRSRGGATYTVQVDGVSAPFEYEVQMLSCD